MSTSMRRDAGGVVDGRGSLWASSSFTPTVAPTYLYGAKGRPQGLAQDRFFAWHRSPGPVILSAAKNPHNVTRGFFAALRMTMGMAQGRLTEYYGVPCVAQRDAP